MLHSRFDQCVDTCLLVMLLDFLLLLTLQLLLLLPLLMLLLATANIGLVQAEMLECDQD